MSAPYTLRAGSAADIEAVMRVMAHAFDPAFGEAWNSGQCLGMLSLPNVWLTLAEDVAPGGATGGATLGFALSRLLVDEAELLLLAVAPAARGRGVGAALIAGTADEAARRGAGRLLLEMREGNPARHLYGREGFAEIGRRAAYYRGPGGRAYDALTLARPTA